LPALATDLYIECSNRLQLLQVCFYAGDIKTAADRMVLSPLATVIGEA
jgi:hypothetical protein